MRRSFAVLLMLSVVFWVRQSAAENQDPFFLSSEAALSGGAVTAIKGDTGAPWSNPAGLVTIDRNSLNISSSAFVLRLRDMPDLLELNLPQETRSEDLSSFEVLSVPSSIVVTKRLGDDFKLAFAVFVPLQDSYAVSAVLNSDIARGEAAGGYRQRLKLSESIVRYHAGPSIGWAATPSLRLGATLFGVYEDGRSEEELATGFVLGPNNRGFIFQRQERDIAWVGGQAVFGVQWDMTETLTLGLTARSPLAIFKQLGSTETLRSRTSLAPGMEDSLDVDFQQTEIDEFISATAHPGRVHLGLAWQSERSWLALEADITPPYKDDTRNLDAGTIINARLGGVMAWDESVSIGLGLFTDLGGEDSPDELLEVRVDYYGVAGGVELRTPHVLAESDEADDLVFSTTIAVRYALGIGEAGGQTFTPFGGQSIDGLEDRTVDVLFHELGLHIGSALFF